MFEQKSFLMEYKGGVIVELKALIARANADFKNLNYSEEYQENWYYTLEKEETNEVLVVLHKDKHPDSTRIGREVVGCYTFHNIWLMELDLNDYII